MQFFSLRQKVFIKRQENVDNYLKHSSSSTVIFFAGWSMDYFPFKPLLIKEDQDILLIYDYRDIASPNILKKTELSVLRNLLYKLKDKSRLELYCWSFGVSVAEYIFRNAKFSPLLKNFTKVVAVNGTLKPIDNDYGIPKLIFKKTLQNIISNIAARNQFNALMCEKPLIQAKFLKYQPARTGDSIISELEDLRDLTKKSSKADFTSTIFNEVLISGRDRVIPTKNQLKFWNEFPEVKKVILENTPHFPFYSHDIF